MTVQNSPVDPNNPVLAEVVDEDEENRRIQEKVERERERQRAEQEGEIPEAEIVIEKQNCTTRVKFWSGVAVVLLVTVAIVLGTILPQKTPPQEVKQELESLLISFSFDDGTALRTVSSPQNKALIWLSNNTYLNSYSNAAKIQRYALATLFYSTNGNSWYSKTNWRSNRDECAWYAVYCDANDSIEHLFLANNKLNGTIPNELGLLSNLSESSIVWLLVVRIVWSCVFFIVLSCLLVIFHSTARLSLWDNSLTGTIPSQIALMSNLGESSVVWLLVVRIVLCVFHCTLMLACHFLFYS
jgi:hypothetical protein